MVKLICSDLDGTLLNRRIEISDKNKRAILLAIEKGVKFAFATGRGYHSIKPFISELQLHEETNYCIVYNGSKIYDTVTDAAVYEMPLNQDILHMIYDTVKQYDLDIQVYEGDNLYLETDSKRTRHYTSKYSYTPKFVENVKLAIHKPISKILLNGEEHSLLALKPVLTDMLRDSANVFFSHANFLEIVSGDASKGNAVLELGKLLSIEKEHILAIGDNQNDISMILAAGIGVAVSNAHADLKAVANVNLPFSNDEHALYEVINRFVFEK